jgi:hypothetical protein
MKDGRVDEELRDGERRGGDAGRGREKRERCRTEEREEGDYWWRREEEEMQKTGDGGERRRRLENKERGPCRKSEVKESWEMEEKKGGENRERSKKKEKGRWDHR